MEKNYILFKGDKETQFDKEYIIILKPKVLEYIF